MSFSICARKGCTPLQVPAGCIQTLVDVSCMIHKVWYTSESSNPFLLHLFKRMDIKDKATSIIMVDLAGHCTMRMHKTVLFENRLIFKLVSLHHAVVWC